MLPLTNLLPSEYLRIAEELKVPLAHLVQAIALLEEGASIPFLGRFRKEVTGNMDEDQLRRLAERLEDYRELEQRRRTVLESTDGQERLPSELRTKLETTIDPQELEDLSLLCRPRREGPAASAREKGLEPLADWLWAQKNDGRAPEEVAATLVQPEKGIENVEQALDGARAILAERISTDPEFRRLLREKMWQEGVVVARKSPGVNPAGPTQKAPKSKYEAYFDFHEPVSRIPSHRLLAIRRGVKEGELEAEIRLDESKAVEAILTRTVHDRTSVFASHLSAAAREGYQRLLCPALQKEIRTALKERSDEEAIRVFEQNLRGLLLGPPAGPLSVLGIDPVSDGACQAVIVNRDGKYVEGAPVPLGPALDGAPERVEAARAVLKELIARHDVQAVAIVGGPGARQVDSFVRGVIREEKATRPELEKLFSIVVNEAGASSYASSRLAKEEFPELDAATRRAISIARRLQDPLAELVKIDPKAIGVGQYHHDVDQEKLDDRLQAVVTACANRLGVDANTASASLLRWVSGLSDRLARRLVEYRQTTGPFTSRLQLKQVQGFSDRVFQQAAGFLRIPAAEHPLDRTLVHPESYPIVEKMAASLSVSVADLAARPEVLETLKLEDFQTDRAGLPTLRDICGELRRGGADPRGPFSPPRYRDDINCISDLKPGMELEGMVTNVTNFGVFVDVGVPQDGLVHVSELSEPFARDLRTVKVGDTVKVRVLAADLDGKRISLSMKPAPPPRERPRPRHPEKAVERSAEGRLERPAEKQPKRAEAQAEAPQTAPKPKPPRPPQPPPLTMEQKLAILQSKFRTRT